MAKQHQPQAEAPQEATPEAPPAMSAPINFSEPVGVEDQVAVVSDAAPEGFVDPAPVISPEQMAALQQEALRDDKKRDFLQKVLDARKPPPPPPPPPPLAPRVAAQTNAEIEAGRQMNAHHAALANRRRAPAAPDPTAGDNKPVFRPADYDEYRTTFKSPVQTQSKDNVRQPALRG